MDFATVTDEQKVYEILFLKWDIHSGELTLDFERTFHSKNKGQSS